MKEVVRRVVSSVLGIPEDEVTETTGPETVEAWDSLQHMNLILALEEELEIQFSDDDIVQMLDVAKIEAKVAELAGV